MATKKSEKTASKARSKSPAKKATTKAAPKVKAAAVKKAPKVKADPAKAKARHPKARATEVFGGKEALAKTLAQVLARADEDTDQLVARLKKASNSQLLRLQRASETLKEKFGNRDKLIAAIGTAEHKSKDKDYLTKLDSYSLPQLLDLAAAAQRTAPA